MLLAGLSFLLVAGAAEAPTPQTAGPPRIVEDPDRHATPQARIVPPLAARTAAVPQVQADGEVVNKAISPAPAPADRPDAPNVPAEGEVLEKGDLSYDPIAPLTPA